jgi:hypothetical protein
MCLQLCTKARTAHRRGSSNAPILSSRAKRNLVASPHVLDCWALKEIFMLCKTKTVYYRILQRVSPSTITSNHNSTSPNDGSDMWQRFLLPRTHDNKLNFLIRCIRYVCRFFWKQFYVPVKLHLLQ